MRLFLKVLCFPAKALGSVSIDGNVITEGSTISTPGELIIDCGTYSFDEIKLYNNDQEWTGEVFEGNKVKYNLFSNGTFKILNSQFKTIFNFSADIAFDFSIASVNSASTSTPLFPGEVLASNTYAQIASRDRRQFSIWTISADNDLSNLELSATNGAVVRSYDKSPTLDGKYLRILIDLSAVELGSSVSIIVGNVMVAFIERVI